MNRNARSSAFNNMPLVYTENNDENYPQITSMLRKTKRDESRLAGSANKRAALATISNLQNVNSTNTDLGKQIRQRQTNPFSIRVDTKKPSPKQKQIATRAQRTTCTNSRANSVLRQSTLSSFSATTSSAPFTVLKDRASTGSTSSTTFGPLRDRSNIPTPTSSKAAELCPMSVEKSRAPLAPRIRHTSTASLLSARNISMDVDDSSSMSNMSIDLAEEEPKYNDIDKDAGLEESPEYIEDIDNHLRKMEEQYKPRVGYMARQRHITHSNRSVVVDWMFEVCDEFNLSQKTFQLAVSYVDRFLSKMSMPRKNLQLLGTTALFIACKVEEIFVPAGNVLAARFVWITDNTYTVNQLFKMECMLLNKLEFEINSPTSLCFQDRFLKASGGDCTEQYFTEYLCNRSLIHGDEFLKYTPSLLTAAAVGLSRAVLTPSEPVWTPTLAHYTKYSYTDLGDCMSDLLKLYKTDYTCTAETRVHAAVWNKYSLPRYMFVLRKQPIDTLPQQ